MTLIELQKILGERILIEKEKENLSNEERVEQNKISENIARLAKQMINNADVILRTDKLCNRTDRTNHIVGEVSENV